MPVIERALTRRTSAPLRLARRWSVSVEWEPRDLWVGAFVKRERRPALRPGLHIYLCPLPTVVLHLVWMGERDAR